MKKQFLYAPVDNGSAATVDTRKPITLTSDEVYEQLHVISKDNIGTKGKGTEDETEFNYARIAWSGQNTAFTADVAFAEALEAGDIYSCTLKPNSYERPVMEKDEDGNLQETDNMETVNNFVYGNHMTWEQKLALEDRKDKVREIAERSDDRKIDRQLKLANANLKPMTNIPALEEAEQG